VSGSDLFVLLPWLAFGVALVIFYFWQRRPPRSPMPPTPGRPYVPPPAVSGGSQPGREPGADGEPEPGADGSDCPPSRDRHKTSS
jgi:hypothetical protein